jgi:hypothetical protein
MHAEKRPALELADVVRAHGLSLLEPGDHRLSPEQYRALVDIMTCKTEARGGHVYECNRCGHQEICYNSCLNRHCPKCQAAARGRWLEARQQELLDVEYFHVTFTAPHEIAALALGNKRVLYAIHLRASAETLLDVARDPRHLGADIGFLSLLHTWGQSLCHHPHVHCVVPGGGLSPDGSSWVSCGRGFFLPVRVLSEVYRGKFLQLLKRARKQGVLSFAGGLSNLQRSEAWARFLAALYEKDWVVNVKPPLGGPDRVLKYLARYTHRVAISNQRLVCMENGKVTFTYKDYARGGPRRTMTLCAREFLRRFLQHVLPRRFMRIRYYGFLSARHRSTKLARCKQLVPPPPPPTEDTQADPQTSATAEGAPCPHCKNGTIHKVRILGEPSPRRLIPWPDTS